MRREIIFILLLILSISFISAGNCPPDVPKIYYGIVFYNSQQLIGNYEIRAVIGSDNVGISNVVNGNYEIDVSPCSGVTGTVYFYINGIKTNESGFYNGMDDWGKSENLNLTLKQIPGGATCDDGLIQPGEECDGTNLAERSVNNCGTNWTGTISCSSNCKIDYSNCTYNPPSPSGGSSPPGSSPSGGSSPSSSSGSSGGTLPSSDGVIHLNPSNTETSNNKENKEKETQEVGNQIPLTGNAILNFVKSGRGLTILGIVVILIIGIGVMVLKKKSLK